MCCCWSSDWRTTHTVVWKLVHLPRWADHSFSYQSGLDYQARTLYPPENVIEVNETTSFFYKNGQFNKVLIHCCSLQLSTNSFCPWAGRSVIGCQLLINSEISVIAEKKSNAFNRQYKQEAFLFVDFFFLKCSLTNWEVNFSPFMNFPNTPDEKTMKKAVLGGCLLPNLLEPVPPTQVHWLFQ